MSAPSIGLLLGIVALALAVLSLYKWNKVSALLMYSAVQLDRAEGSELIGLTPPPWLQNKMLPDKDTPGLLLTASCDPHYIQNLMMATVPVGIITMFLLAWLIRLITKMYVRFDSHIVLVLSNDHDCVHLPIKELSECPTAYRLSDKDPHILRLNGLLRNVLYVNWRNTHLHNISTNEIKTFSSSLQVPYLKCYQDRIIKKYWSNISCIIIIPCVTNVRAFSIKMNQLLNFEICCRLILGLSWQSHNCVLTMPFFYECYCCSFKLYICHGRSSAIMSDDWLLSDLFE